jgi:hypothetical protein
MLPDQPLFTIPSGVHTRWASPENPRGEKGAAAQTGEGRKGSPCFPLQDGESRILAETTGSGTIRRFWVTISDRSPEMLRGLRLEMFSDGATKPAVFAPLGDFFCHGLGRISAFQNALFASPEGRSFNCYIPMPFRSGMKIVVTNNSGRALEMFFYDIDYTLGDNHDDRSLYFHSIFRRENPTTFCRDYEFMPLVQGMGRFLGVNFSVIADQKRYFKSWWGEGEVKLYIDGDGQFPTLAGTGTEDYIGTGWGQGQYAGLYQGCPVADPDHMQYAFYRLHIPDPIYFHKSLRGTIQQIGCWGPDTLPQMKGLGLRLEHGSLTVDMEEALKAEGYGLFERQDDWASCAYFYLDRKAIE